MTENAVNTKDLDTESHVWLAWPDAIDEAGQLESCMQLLSQAERERYARFHFEVHRKLYLISHALVRTTLSKYADVSPQDWQFTEGEFGRPEIAELPETLPLRFNLSHTEGLSAVIVTKGYDCGVDVERLHRVKDLQGVAERVFTSSELEDLLGRKDDDLQGRFTDYWTLKEAYMKGRGKGFQLPPHTFTIRIDPQDASKATLDLPDGFDDTADDWRLALHVLGSSSAASDSPDYRLAAAVRVGAHAQHRIVIHDGELG